MADGNFVRKSNVKEGAMVYGPTVYDVPLLPYERELIKTIGITEEEYQLFAAEVRRRGRLRPAEYAHIPDIVNEPVIECDPVKCLKLLSSSSIVKADPLPPEPVL